VTYDKSNKISADSKADIIIGLIIAIALIALIVTIGVFVQLATMEGTQRVAACVSNGGTWESDGERQSCIIDDKESRP